jgi:hypothetical protein
LIIFLISLWSQIDLIVVSSRSVAHRSDSHRCVSPRSDADRDVFGVLDFPGFVFVKALVDFVQILVSALCFSVCRLDLVVRISANIVLLCSLGRLFSDDIGLDNLVVFLNLLSPDSVVDCLLDILPYWIHRLFVILLLPLDNIVGELVRWDFVDQCGRRLANRFFELVSLESVLDIEVLRVVVFLLW